jgi:PTH1 family peptidyl-tRNA hydrolase
MTKKWIVGLGNPGKKYERTRHNAGFMVLQGLADSLGMSLDTEKHGSLYARKHVDGFDVALILPQTFMNDSGEALAQWQRRDGLDPEKGLLVVYDDMDLPLGKLRSRAKGSAGSHNGMASVIDRLGSPDFNRLRIGIGKPEDPSEWPDYVLKKFGPLEKESLKQALERAGQAARDWVSHDSFERLMGKYNG